MATRARTRGVEGFTILEVMFSIAVLTIGLLSLLSLFALAAASVKYSQEDLIAKQKAREAIEGVYSARNDTFLTFDSIQNVGNGGGIFKNGFNSLYLAGSNGIVGTTQDTTTLDSIKQPGPDGRLGTADDVTIPLNNYSRQILFAPITNADGSTNQDYRHVTVTVRVTSPGRGTRDYSESAFISRFP